MKKKIIVMCSVCVALALAVIGVRHFNVSYATIASTREELASNFQELEHASDLIIRAKVLSGKENVLVHAHNDGSVILNGYTLTELQVQEVYSGNASVNETITITEEYYTTQDTFGTTIWSQGSYLPAKVNEEYIFFLRAYKSDTKYAGMYFPVDLEKGKYSVDSAATYSSRNSAGSLELKEGSDIGEYLSYYEQVVQKYLN